MGGYRPGPSERRLPTSSPFDSGVTRPLVLTGRRRDGKGSNTSFFHLICPFGVLVVCLVLRSRGLLSRMVPSRPVSSPVRRTTLGTWDGPESRRGHLGVLPSRHMFRPTSRGRWLSFSTRFCRVRHPTANICSVCVRDRNDPERSRTDTEITIRWEEIETTGATREGRDCRVQCLT